MPNLPAPNHALVSSISRPPFADFSLPAGQISLEATSKRRPSNDVHTAFGELLEAMPAQAAILDADAHILATNYAWRQAGIDGLALGGITHPGDSYIEACRARARLAGDARILGKYLSDLRQGSQTRISHIYSMIIDGKKRRFVANGARLRDHNGEMLLSFSEITDVDQMVEERRRHCLSLLHAEEEERKRIARELHDETAQQLALMQFGLMALRDARNGTAIESACNKIEEALGQVQHQVRTLSYVLHPPEIGTAGIEIALHNFAKGFGRRAGLHIEFRNEAGHLELDQEAEVALYRVAQEALMNVHKHAAASRTSVRLLPGDRELILEIEDNGIGMPKHIASTRSAAELGVGLVGMRERIEALGGRLDVIVLPVGTRISARIPY
ncbi:sensor histidine kinase [Sphingomonas cavernae]|nr:sensor histidine kinase [Sphingomonas cavernae]